MNTITETHLESGTARIAFPEVVRRLSEAGVESYHADLVRLEKTYYFPNGDTQIEPMSPAETPIEGPFAADQVLAAIRESQAGTLKYPDFLKRIRQAGTTNYSVYINGRRAIYFGRQGDFHVEQFPQ